MHSPAFIGVLLALSVARTLAAQAEPRFLNPKGLATPRGYTHVVEVPVGRRLVFLSGQVPLDSLGQLVGPADFRTQATQVFENLRLALAGSHATFKDVVKLTFYLKDVANLPVLREVRDQYVNTLTPPASTLVQVVALFQADILLEVEATAAASP